MILSSYPMAINPVNADCYATQVIALLASYPPEVISRMAEPVNGVVGKLQFLPSVAELKKEADSLMKVAKARVEIADAEAAQIAERNDKRLIGKSSD
jgi:hypothetical protein